MGRAAEDGKGLGAATEDIWRHKMESACAGPGRLETIGKDICPAVDIRYDDDES